MGSTSNTPDSTAAIPSLPLPTTEWLTDPRIYAVNRLKAHADHTCWTHAPENSETGSLKQSLDGEWQVHVEPVKRPAQPGSASPLFTASGFDGPGFSSIAVPSNLQSTGLLTPQYVNIQYPWDGHEDPHAPDIPEANHVALYRRTKA